MILKGKATSVKKHSGKSKRAKKNAAKMDEKIIIKDCSPKDCLDRVCPLCILNLDLQDYDFYPCLCGYQICGFCWHKIRTEGNCLCPNCRRLYTENPVGYKPVSQELVQKIKQEKKQKELKKKKQQLESRKQLANIRVVQKNLVFVHGLPQGIDHTEKYRKLQQTFKDFGPVVKCVVNNKTSYVGSQIPRASVYITYQRIEDALKAYKSLPSRIEDYEVKTSLGTTKYCSNFLKNAHCPKQDCMYLHEVADDELCFTKDQIHNGDHLEFGDQLYEKMVNHSSSKSPPTNQQSSNKDTVPAVINEQEDVATKLNSLQIDPVPTPPSPRPKFPSEPPTSQQSKLQHLFSSSNRDSSNQVNGTEGTTEFSKSYEEYRNKFIPSFVDSSPSDASIQKSLLDESIVNTSQRPVLNSENLIKPESLNSSHKEMWPDQRGSITVQSNNIHNCQNASNVSNDYVRNHVNTTSQVLQGLTLNREDGPFFQKRESPEVPDDDLGFDPIAISISGLTNILKDSQQLQPTKRDIPPWPQHMPQQMADPCEQQALQYKLQMQRLKNPPPGFPVNHVQPNQPLQSPVYNNPDTSNNVLIKRMSPPPPSYPPFHHQFRHSERAARYHPHRFLQNGNSLLSRMSPVINGPNFPLRTNFPAQRYQPGNMAMNGITAMNGFPSQSHRTIAPQTIPLQAQSMQEMLARTANNTHHIQSQSQNLSNHMQFAHLEQNLSPSLWNVNQTSINPTQWMQTENSFMSQNMQDFRPASPSLSLSRRVHPQLRPEIARQIAQPLARFTNPPTFTDNSQYMFPNGQQYNQLTKGVHTFP